MEKTELIRERIGEMGELKRHLSTVRLSVLTFFFGIFIGVLTNLIAVSVPSAYFTIYNTSFDVTVTIATGLLAGLFVVFAFCISYVTIPREFYEVQPLPPQFSELFGKLVKKNADYKYVTKWILNHLLEQIQYTTKVAKTSIQEIEKQPFNLRLSIRKGRWVKGLVVAKVFAFPAYAGASISGFSIDFKLMLKWYCYLNPRITERYFELRQTLSLLSLACARRIMTNILSKAKEVKR